MLIPMKSICWKKLLIRRLEVRFLHGPFQLNQRLSRGFAAIFRFTQFRAVVGHKGTLRTRSQLIVLTENRIVLTIVELIDLGLVVSFDCVHPYTDDAAVNSLFVGAARPRGDARPEIPFPILQKP
jgi:hypothetical protein